MGKGGMMRTSAPILLGAQHTAFHLPRVFYGISGPWFGLEARLGDGLAGPLADPVAAIANFTQGGIDFAQKLAVLLDQAQRELLLVVVRAHVGHVDGKIGEIAA